MPESNTLAEAANEATAGAAATAEAMALSSEPGMLHDFFHTGALGMLVEGGPFMIPILLLGILALGVIIERWRSLRMVGANSDQLREEVFQMLSEDRVEDALQHTENSTGPVAAVLSTGLRKYLVLRRLNYDAGRIEEQVNNTMENYGVHIVAALERHLAILATVASVAPMLGFLGTLVGMIAAFKNIVLNSGNANIVELAAAGIMVALLTTCFGLIIGIPAYMAFNYFTSVINRHVLDVEESATELISLVSLKTTLENAKS